MELHDSDVDPHFSYPLVEPCASPSPPAVEESENRDQPFIMRSDSASDLSAQLNNSPHAGLSFLPQHVSSSPLMSGSNVFEDRQIIPESQVSGLDIHKPIDIHRPKDFQKPTFDFQGQTFHNKVRQTEGLISSLPSQKCALIAKRGAVFTIMLAGESGLGKTTFINTLFDDKFDTSKDTKLFSQTLDRPLQSWEKTAKIELKEAEYEENGFRVKFTVIDTPGFGDYSNNNNSWVPLVNYIDSQHRMYMLQEEQPDRKQLTDSRVHVCLYFIRPNGHGLLPLDIRVMKELCTRVNLIPVIAKADSLTPEDRDRFKQEIRTSIASNQIQVYDPTLSFEDSFILDEEDEDFQHMPFGIMASEDYVDLDDGTRVRGRNYRWGTAQVENPDHCDFVRLKRVLMSKHMLDLIDATVEKHYESYRKANMLLRIRHAQNVAMEQRKGTSLSHLQGELDEEGGLNTLKSICPYGLEFLETLLEQNDAILLDREKKLRDDDRLRNHFQERKFGNWSNDLETQKIKLAAEIDMMKQDIRRTEQELSSISYENGGISSRQGRYALRK